MSHKKFRYKDKKDRATYIQRAHAKNQAWDRYRVVLNRPQMVVAIAQIKDNGSVFVGHSTNTRKLHLIWIQCTWLPVVYNKNRSCLVTTLPWEAMKEWSAMTSPDVKWEFANQDKVRRIHKECVNGRYICLRPPYQWELEGVGV